MYVLSMYVCAQFSKFILGCIEVINFCYHQMSIKGEKNPTTIWCCFQLIEGEREEEWDEGEIPGRMHYFLSMNNCTSVNFMWWFGCIEIYHLLFLILSLSRHDGTVHQFNLLESGLLPLTPNLYQWSLKKKCNLIQMH